MLDIRWIRENPQALADALEKRQWSAEEARSTVDDIIARDEARRKHLADLQAAQTARNVASKEIGDAMRNKDLARAEKLKADVTELKEFIQSGEARERELDKALNDALAVIPNVPLDDVPVGKDEHDNVEVRSFGRELIDSRKRLMPNKPKEHFEIGEALGLMDFERAVKLSGARFTVLKGQLARLERALGQFMLDLHTTEHGYEEVQPPLMVREEVMYGTGQLPKFEGDLFRTERPFDLSDFESRQIFAHEENLLEVRQQLEQFANIPKDVSRRMTDGDVKRVRLAARYQAQRSGLPSGQARDLYLIPTAEVPLTNLVRKEIVAHDSLPRRFTALTPCFRSEAGSAGKDTRGMLRQHQFYKVELVSITDQESSLAEHERMTTCAEEVLKRLGLPFRTVVLSTGDMGFGARKTYDIEVWLPGQNAYREISSCSVCGDFQARRMDARYRDKEGKVRFVHTLNGSGVALGRALIAVLENYQDEDGGVTIPDALLPYMGGLTKIEAR